MHALNNGVTKIEALIGTNDLHGLAWDLASRAVDAILEDGTETHTGWDASLAIEYAAPHVKGIEDVTDDEETQALQAVEAAVRTIEELATAPRGIVLVCADDDHVYGIGTDLATAQREAEVGGAYVWERVLEDDFSKPRPVGSGIGRFLAYEAPLVDWYAPDGQDVRAIGEFTGRWLCRPVIEEAA